MSFGTDSKAIKCPVKQLQDKISIIERLQGKINQHSAALSYAKSAHGCFKLGGHNYHSGNSSNFMNTSPELTKLIIIAIQDELDGMVAQHEAEVEKLAAIQKLWS